MDMSPVVLNTATSHPYAEQQRNDRIFIAGAEDAPEREDVRDPDDVIQKVGEAKQGGLMVIDSGTPYKYREGGWGWICVASYFIMNILTAGLVNVFSMISIELQIRYGISAQAAGWVYSINMVSYMFSGPLCSALCRRYSCRRVAITCAVTLTSGVLCLTYAPNIFIIYFGYSIVGGVSSGMLSLIGVLIIGEYFNERRGKATGIIESGRSIGQMIYAPLFSFLFVHYGYQGALLLTAGLLLHLLVGGALLRSARTGRRPGQLQERSVTCPVAVDDDDDATKESAVAFVRPPREADETTATEGGATDVGRSTPRKIDSLIDLSLLRDATFLSYGGLLFCVNSAMNSFYNSSLAGIADEMRFTRSQVALLISLAGGVGFVAKIVGGFAFDVEALRGRRVHLSMACYLVPPTVMMLMPTIDDKRLLFACWMLFTTAASLASSQSSVVMVDVIGVRRHSSAVGLAMPFRGLGILMGPTLGGYLRDVTESYSTSLYVIGSINLVVILITEFILLLNRRKLDRIRRENFNR